MDICQSGSVRIPEETLYSLDEDPPVLLLCEWDFQAGD